MRGMQVMTAGRHRDERESSLIVGERLAADRLERDHRVLQRRTRALFDDDALDVDGGVLRKEGLPEEKRGGDGATGGARSGEGRRTRSKENLTPRSSPFAKSPLTRRSSLRGRL
jgi:hypothetical protein